jgi:hypothetical protein
MLNKRLDHVKHLMLTYKWKVLSLQNIRQLKLHLTSLHIKELVFLPDHSLFQVKLLKLSNNRNLLLIYSDKRGSLQLKEQFKAYINLTGNLMKTNFWINRLRHFVITTKWDSRLWTNIVILPRSLKTYQWIFLLLTW